MASVRGDLAVSGLCCLGHSLRHTYLTPMPQVLNVRQLPGFGEHRPIIPPGTVYIGRRNARYGLAASQWANSFRVSQEADRASAIAAYKRWLCQQPRLMEALCELNRCDLVCWCARPATATCC
jgi:hypothetical protein